MEEVSYTMSEVANVTAKRNAVKVNLMTYSALSYIVSHSFK